MHVDDQDEIIDQFPFADARLGPWSSFCTGQTRYDKTCRIQPGYQTSSRSPTHGELGEHRDP